MSTSWAQRKVKLRAILGNDADEDGEGLALDGLLHGQSVIGRTRTCLVLSNRIGKGNVIVVNVAKTVEVEKLRFSNKDLEVLGPLAAGQFGKVRTKFSIHAYQTIGMIPLCD